MRELHLLHGSVKLDDDDYEKYAHLNWCSTSKGYVVRHVKGQKGKQSLHRLILGVESHEWADHINGDRMDNRKENLRKCSRLENSRNMGKRKCPTSSKFKGVYWDSQMSKYRARLYHDGKNHHIGLFDTQEDAAKAYNKKALAIQGTFARINTI